MALSRPIQRSLRARRMATRTSPARSLRQLRKSAETEIRPQPGAFHLAPADAREIAGDQSDDDAARGQAPQQVSNARADFSRNVRNAADVDGLRASHHFRHHALDCRARHARASASSRPECRDPACPPPERLRWWSPHARFAGWLPPALPGDAARRGESACRRCQKARVRRIVSTFTIALAVPLRIWRWISRTGRSSAWWWATSPRSAWTPLSMRRMQVCAAEAAWMAPFIARAARPSCASWMGFAASTGGCPTGSAVATGAGSLPAQHVFHAVGPVYRDGRHGEPEQLANCYRTCLDLAEQHGVRTISFPGHQHGRLRLSAGRSGRDSARHHCASACENPDCPVQDVLLVLFDQGTYAVLSQPLPSVSRPARLPRSRNQARLARQGLHTTGWTLFVTPDVSSVRWCASRSNIASCDDQTVCSPVARANRIASRLSERVQLPLHGHGSCRENEP